MILAGAAALGAYEVGVLSHLVDEVARDVAVSPMPAVLSGTSAGAINASALAAFADDPKTGIDVLRSAWSELGIGQMLRPSSIEIISMFLDVTGAPVALRRALQLCAIRGGLLAPDPVAHVIARAPIARIADHLRAGRFDGIAISATRIANGEAVVFTQARETPQIADDKVTVAPTQLTHDHVLASAAIPLLFPSVRIDGDRYCDGGLRQMVPLSPAIHLGAERLLVINPLPATRPAASRPASVTSPLYLAGKAINALFADRMEADYARLSHITAIVRAGRRRFGPAFDRDLNAELARDGMSGLREIDAVRIEPTRDLSLLAADYVTSAEFSKRAPGAAGRLVRILADGDPERAGDLFAFLLFDGGFTSALIDIGRADARAHHEQLCALWQGQVSNS